MKRVIQLLILLILSTIVYSQLLSDNQVIQIIKDFENNQNLNLTNYRIIVDNDFQIYIVNSHTTDGLKIWFVTISNNEVIDYALSLPDVGTTSRIEKTQNDAIYSLAQCKSIADNYLNSKNVLVNSFDTPGVYWDNGQYNFLYENMKFGNINLRYRSRYKVSVDGDTRIVTEYKKEVLPELIMDNPPSLTDNEMLNIISNYSTNFNNNNPRLSPYRYSSEGNSIERFAMYMNNGVIIHIDAFNHNITKIDVPGGGFIPNIDMSTIKEPLVFPLEFDKKYKIIKKDINQYLVKTKNINEVNYKEVLENVIFSSKQKDIARIDINGNRYFFKDGSYWCFINNKTYNMGGNCIIENGKLKLPEEFYKKVQDKDYKFF